MRRYSWLILAGCCLGLLALLVALPCPVPACSFCANLQQAATFRQDLSQAKLILYGTLFDPQINVNKPGGGITKFRIKNVIKSDPFLGNRDVIELPRYIPVGDPKNPPLFLLFCDVFQNKLDPYRGVPIKSEDALAYMKGIISLQGKDRTQTLLFHFNYLEHEDKEIAFDAFLEFAKASDKEIGQLAGKLSREKLRTWLKNPQTLDVRLGVYAFLLGGCGKDEDAALLRSLMQNPTDRILNAFDGILGGYMQLRPQDGWDLALSMLRDTRKPFSMRMAILRTLRFYHGWKATEVRKQILSGMGAILAQSDLADLAVEDLRRWRLWDLTGDILALYGKKGYEAPLMQRAVLRYALSCTSDKAEAARFVAERRRAEPDLIKEIEEALQFEKSK